jgi:hypothetical protein
MRTELERLMASFKGKVKVAPPARPHVPKGKTKRLKKPKGALTEIERSIEAAEAQMRVEEAPADEARDATKEVNRGTIEADPDHDAGDEPADLARRAFRMPKDKRSRGYVEMMTNAADDDDEYYGGARHLQSPIEREWEARWRASAKDGKNCGKCGKPLKAGEPVWLLRREYDGDEPEEWRGDGTVQSYVTEEVVAPVCERCRHRAVEMDLTVPRETTSGPCTGCGRLVHVTPKALRLWLARSKRVCCCDDCAQRPGRRAMRTCAVCGKLFASRRRDAKTCGSVCRKKAERAKKS